MTKRLSCPPAPGPLEDYAAQFDPLLGSLAQRRGLRAYLQGLLLPRDRNKTLTCLAGAEPIVGAQQGAVQGLQFFLSESPWDHEQLNQRRLELLCGDPATAPHERGVLVLDDSGDRKDGHHTAHVARQYLGSVGKTDNGIVAVTSLWASERVYWPAHVQPYTPASRLPKGKRDSGFRTKPQLAAELVAAAQQAGIPFRAVVADCFYGDNEGFVEALGHARVAFVLAVKPRKGVWAPADAVHTPQEAARQLAWTSPAEPGDWTPVTRRFRDGHTHARHPPLPRRAHPDLVGGRRAAARGGLGPGPAAAAGGGDHRPGHAAEADHLVSGHQPGSPRAPAGTPGPRAGRPGRGGAPVRAAHLGRAGLQAGQGGARLGRLPGPQRPRDPPPLDPGVLRLQLLLAGVVRQAAERTVATRRPARPGGRAGGASQAARRAGTARSRGRRRCAGCGPG